MIQTLKQIGKGTTYEFRNHSMFTPLPSRNGVSTAHKSIIDNEWYDKSGVHYKLSKDTLCISVNDFFPNDGYSIIDYINEIPDGLDLTIMLRIKSKPNEMAGLNVLCNLLSTYLTRKNVVIDITDMEFCEKVALDIDNLPDNVKLTSLIDRNLNENYIFSNQSFESYAMNSSEENFDLLVSKLTATTRKRIIRMREICSNFYRFAPGNLKTASSKEKTMFAYNWCLSNIKYDINATNSDGTLKNDRKDSQDPIITFDNRMGVCEGRARLLKLLLNNYYMKVPCFLVKGMSGRLQHTWNEIILEDGSVIDLDISKQNNRIANNHDELNNFNSVPIAIGITLK